MKRREPRLEKVVGEKARERFEQEVERAREQAVEMKRRAVDNLLRDSKILCIETEPQAVFEKPAFQEGVHAEQQELAWEASMGGDRTPLYSAVFRYAFGFDPDDERFPIWRAAHGESQPPVDLSEIDAVLVTGSSSMVTEMQDDPSGPGAQWMRRVHGFFDSVRERKRVDGVETPVLAVCFGHQIYAAHRGGSVEWMNDQSGNPIREIGPARIHLTEAALQDPLLADFPDDYFVVQSSHRQHVAAAPENAIVLAHNPASDVQMLRYVDQLHWSIQNHPELAGVLIDAVARLRSDSIREEYASLSPDARARLEAHSYDELLDRIATIDTTAVRLELFGRFLDVVGDNIRKKNS